LIQTASNSFRIKNKNKLCPPN